MKRLLLAGLLSLPLPAADLSDKLWRVSQAALIGANTADLASNWAGPEANRLLANGQGRMGWQGRAIKLGGVGGIVLVQQRRHRKWWTVVNFGAAAGFAFVAGRNLK
jgi:hypothetical protein